MSVGSAVHCSQVWVSKTLVLYPNFSLTTKSHISSLVRSANFELLWIGSIPRRLSTDAAKTIVSALDSLRLDYCKSLLPGLIPSVSVKQSTKASTQRCSSCPVSSQNWPHFSSSYSCPLAAHWFTNTVQGRFSAVLRPLLATWLNSLKFTNQLVSYALLVILPILFCLLSEYTRSLGQRSLSYAILSV